MFIYQIFKQANRDQIDLEFGTKERKNMSRINNNVAKRSKKRSEDSKTTIIRRKSKGQVN